MRTAIVAMLVAGGAAAAERQNALDMNQGAILVSESGSYADGINGWSAFHLTDGAVDQGWCSPDGKPAGATFVWELDTTWRLSTLVLDTHQLQESSYPGISAKTVELLVSADGRSWKSAGRFEVGREDRREHALPPGTTAAHVKLVVVDNHGDPRYTELAEVELYGERVTPTPTRDVAGVYKTSYGPMRFVQERDQVYGCYDWNGTGYVWGTVTGNVIQVTWHEPESSSEKQGTATFAVAGDRLSGVWFRQSGALAGEWSGSRAGAGEAPRCTPARRDVVGDALKREGKAILYGIRFDSGSDAPRAESATTLEALAAALAGEAGMKVEIAGHTDSTGGDAANVDLSLRRARAVVDWLRKKGIAAGRLAPRGYGSARPVADNATAQGRALNRRVEVTVVK